MKLLFFFYFLLKSNYRQVFRSLQCLKGKYNSVVLVADALLCSFKYGTSLDDYFSFRFYEKSNVKRAEFATTAYMYVFHKKFNEKEYKPKIDDKSQFRIHFKLFSGTSEEFHITEKDKFVNWLVSQDLKQIVIKDPLGNIGKSIHFFNFITSRQEFQDKNQAYTVEELFQYFSIGNKLYVEPRINQHSLIQKLAPTALNTIRVITIVRLDGKVDIISAAFRISVNSETDNFSTGNLAAAVDVESGIVISSGIKRLAACSNTYEYHPITGEKILGIQIPHWGEVRNLVHEAALVFPQVRTVGWDVAILEDRPIIIEGNPSWNKGAPQIPLDKGIKPLLDKYLVGNLL